MSIEVCIVGSGSGGNCTVVRTPGGVMLVDAGIGPRTAAVRLAGTGVVVRDVAAICLTHLDRDHFTTTWLRTIRQRQIRVFCHAGRAKALRELCEDRLDGLIESFIGDFQPLPGLRVHPIPLAHDLDGSHGFLIEGFGCRVGYATDLGRVPAELIERFAPLDLLALESNYDVRMQLDSPRPWFLKRRIMGGRGHLSNEQAFAAVCQILDRHELWGAALPAHIVLLHRSLECNCPRLLRRLFCRDKRIRQRLTLAEQFQRSRWLRVGDSTPLIGEQLVMGWG